MSILTINNLSHVYDSKKIFEDAELSINNGEHAGIVGLNGAGKSTFMNIIAGRVVQDAGEIKWLNGIRWGYLDQHATMDKSQTVMEYLKTAFDYLYELSDELDALYEAMASQEDMDELDKMVNRSAKMQERLDNAGFYDIEATIKKVANGLGVGAIGYDKLVGQLSGGQRAKIMLSKLLLEKLDVMLLDEPTNFLDIEHIEWLTHYLNDFEGTFLLVSHDTKFLNDTCRLIINVENGELRRYSGNYESFVTQHEMNSRQHQEAYDRQQRKIKEMQDYINRNKARAATAGMANSRQKMLDKMDIIDKPVQFYEASFSFPYVMLYTNDMLIAKDLCIGYDRQLLPPINIHMKSDTKLWIRGTNGIGKSTLIKTLLGLVPALGGTSKFHLDSKILYLEQDLNFKDTGYTGLSYMNELYPRMNQKECRSELAKVGIIKEMSTKPIELLSGGEQVRIKLCGLMQKESNILILDEPTNHLDVKAKDALCDALKAYDGAIILVSHETEFAEAVCNNYFDIVDSNFRYW